MAWALALAGTALVVAGGIAVGRWAQHVVKDAANRRDQQMRQALGDDFNKAGAPPQQQTTPKEAAQQ